MINQAITVRPTELMEMLTMAAESAIAKYVAMSNPTSDLISQREAYRLYGKARVQKWVDAQLIKNHGRLTDAKNSKRLYSKSELAQAEYAERVKGALFFAR